MIQELQKAVISIRAELAKKLSNIDDLISDFAAGHADIC